MLHIIPSYVPVSADDGSLHMGNTERDMELLGLPWGRRRAEWPGESHEARGGGRRAVGAATPTAMVTTHGHKDMPTIPELGREQSSPFPQVLMQFEATTHFPAAQASAAWSSLVAELSPVRDFSVSTG